MRKAPLTLTAFFLLMLAGLFSASGFNLSDLHRAAATRAAAGKASEHRMLYVATPGIRNYLEYGGHGLLVFDIDDGHRFVKRIPTSGFDKQGQPEPPTPTGPLSFITSVNHRPAFSIRNCGEQRRSSSTLGGLPSTIGISEDKD